MLFCFRSSGDDGLPFGEALMRPSIVVGLFLSRCSFDLLDELFCIASWRDSWLLAISGRNLSSFRDFSNSFYSVVMSCFLPESLSFTNSLINLVILLLSLDDKPFSPSGSPKANLSRLEARCYESVSSTVSVSWTAM